MAVHAGFEESGPVIAKLPKWLLYGTVLGVLIAVLMLFSVERVMLPGTARPSPSLPPMPGPTTVVAGATGTCAVPKRRWLIATRP
jgi:hypothetical protein